MKLGVYRAISVLLALLSLSPAAIAQSPSPTPSFSPLPVDPLEPLPDLPSEPDDPVQLEDEMPPPEPPRELPATPFVVDEIQVVGNTLFQDEIEALVSPFENAEITLADLLDLRTAITQLYLDAGYISSGAFVPTNQVLDDRVVQIQVIEGAVDEVQINGLSHLRESYVRSRLQRAIHPPLNVRRLEESLQLLQVDPLLRSVDAELTAGSGPGRNTLIVDLVEADPFFFEVAGDNYRAPSIGTAQGTVAATHRNVVGFGDRLNLSYRLTEGLDLYEARYTVPINGLDGTVQLRYETTESQIIDAAFADAGIRSTSETVSISYRQPLTRSLTQEFALGLSFDLRESRSFILDDIPFSFSIGPEDGVAKVSVLRFSQEWVSRDIDTVLAARSQFNLGLSLFDATANDSGTDGRFFSWLGQFQWVEQFSPRSLLVTRLNAQLTPDSLLSLERFSIGGVDTVRGYVQNQVVTDNAITASTEYRHFLASNLQVSSFLEAGGGWNTDTPDPDPAFLLGLGLGLQWQPVEELNLRVDYGVPLVSSSEGGNSLQANGLYFSLNLRPF